jgi:2-polyprenyl-6-methoxyphenol hydroxylase-like FAD-dependent oxidoreductase
MPDRSIQKARSVLISGASIAGPALAYWLDRYGFDVTVVERASAVRSGGYPIDIRGTAIEVIRRMGLLPQPGEGRPHRLALADLRRRQWENGRRGPLL